MMIIRKTKPHLKDNPQPSRLERPEGSETVMGQTCKAEVNCSWCERRFTFEGNRRPRRFYWCSDYCKELHYKGKVTFNCDRCGKEATQLRKYYKRWSRHFCTKRCSDLSRISPNRKPRVEVKCAACDSVKLIIPSHFNRPTKLYFCNSKCKGAWQSLYAAGEHNQNWKGGKSFEPYPFGWTTSHKEKIRERDGRKCQRCGKGEKMLGYRLHVHHIDYNKENIYPWNLISLCRSDHTITNGNRSYWTEYFRKFMGQSKLHGDMQSAAEMTAPASVIGE